MASGCIDTHCLVLGTSWRWVVSFTSLPLYPPEKKPPYPLDWKLGGLQSLSGRREEEKVLDPTGTSTRTPRSFSPVASRYTDCAILACLFVIYDILNFLYMILLAVLLDCGLWLLGMFLFFEGNLLYIDRNFSSSGEQACKAPLSSMRGLRD
jgi:hypothetical protein